MGIEPTYSAWKAEVLPLNYTRKTVTGIYSNIPITPLPYTSPGGGGRIRTSEGGASRFTVCPLWPLGNPSENKPAIVI